MGGCQSASDAVINEPRKHSFSKENKFNKITDFESKKWVDRVWYMQSFNFNGLIKIIKFIFKSP